MSVIQIYHMIKDYKYHICNLSCHRLEMRGGEDFIHLCMTIHLLVFGADGSA